MNNTKITVTAILLAACVSGSADIIFNNDPVVLGTATMNYSGLGASSTMSIWAGDWTGQNVPAGAILMNKTAGTGLGEYINNGITGVFCIDLLQTIQSSNIVYNIISTADGPRPAAFLGGGMGQTKANYLSELWGRYFDPSWTAGGSYTTSQKQAAEAFAAAVWEIVYEDVPASPMYWDVTVDGTAGDKGFRAANLNSTLANSWLHSLDGTGPMADLRVLTNDCSQDFIFAIPEPATLAFAACGFGLMARQRIIRRSKSESR